MRPLEVADHGEGAFLHYRHLNGSNVSLLGPFGLLVPEGGSA